MKIEELNSEKRKTITKIQTQRHQLIENENLVSELREIFQQMNQEISQQKKSIDQRCQSGKTK